jgi:hypothetical protein
MVAAVCVGFKGCGQIGVTLRSLAGSSLQPNFDSYSRIDALLAPPTGLSFYEGHLKLYSSLKFIAIPVFSDSLPMFPLKSAENTPGATSKPPFSIRAIASHMQHICRKTLVAHQHSWFAVDRNKPSSTDTRGSHQALVTRQPRFSAGGTSS